MEVVEWGVMSVLQQGPSVDIASIVGKRGTIAQSVLRWKKRKKTLRGSRIEAGQYPGGETLNCQEMPVMPAGMSESEKV